MEEAVTVLRQRGHPDDDVESRERARDDVREALEDGRYPWYDAASDAPAWDVLRAEVEDPELRELDWLAWVLNGLAAMVLIAVLVSILRAYLAARRRRRPEAPRAEPGLPPPLPVTDPELGTDPTAWLERARERAAAGDYAQAIVALFNHQLLELDRTGRIRLAPGRTNRHYLAELSDEATGRLPFRSSIRAFEAVYYGGRPAGRDAWERFEADHRRLIERGTESVS